MRAQRVQRSAYPQAYAKWKPMAVAVVHAIGGTPQISGTSDSGSSVWNVITNPGTWYRIGLFLLGAAIIVAAIGYWVIVRG